MWRLVVAGVLALDVVWLIAGQMVGAFTGALPFEPDVAFVLAHSPLMNLSLGVIALWALWVFARAPGRALAGLIALVPIAILVATYSRAVSGFHGHFLHAGAVMFGWIAGLWLARLRTRDLEVRERLACVGAVAALAATHFNAGIAKLVGLGSDAIAPWTIQLSLIMDHQAGTTSWTDPLWQPVLASSALASVVALFFIIAELGAPLMVLGPRPRRIWGSVLVAYHGVMSVLFGMVFLEALVLLVVFMAPRHALAPALAAMQGSADGSADGAPSLEPWQRWAPAALALALAVVLVIPSAPVVEQAAPAMPVVVGPPPDSAVIAEALGPVSRGDSLADDWTVVRIEVLPTSATLVVADPDGRTADFLLGLSGEGSFPAGGVTLSVAAEGVGDEALQGAGAALARKLREAGGVDVPRAVERWLRAVATPSTASAPGKGADT